MKRYIAILISVIFAFVVYSCGGGGGGPHLGGSSSNAGYQLTKSVLAFDVSNPDNPIVPFPNDLLLQSTTTRATTASSDPDNKSIYVPTEGVTDPSTLAFYTAINKLYLQGLSPNTPITIPLSTNKVQLDPIQLQNNVVVIDVTNVLDNITNPSEIFAPLIVKQNGNVINAYPIVPFHAGHQYVVIVTNGISNLEASTLLKLLIGNQNISYISQELEQLREAYVGLLPLIQALGIPKDNILEMFTFKVAKKTLGLSDYALIQEAAETGNMSLLDNVSSVAYEYTDLDNMTYAGTNSQNEYLQIDGLSDLPLVCQNLYDNGTLKAYLASEGINLPEITDNLTSFMLTPNVYKLSDIKNVLTKYDFPDNATNYPLVCVSIFDNKTLYDNVTTAIYGNKNPQGIIIYQHGLGKSKTDAKVLADDPNFSNYEFYAMDLPWHGGRIPPNPTLASTCSSTSSGSCYLTSNPINDVMNIYQSLLDMHTFTKFVYTIDASKFRKPVYFVSQSMGSITGSMLLNIDNITYSNVLKNSGLQPNNYISEAVLNVGGANYSSILNEAKNPEILGLLCGALNIPTNQCTPTNVAKYRDTVKYNMTLALFQLVLDPVDPAFMARNSSIKSKLIIQSAYNDTLVPNIANQLLYGDFLSPANLSEVFSFTPISCDNTTISATAGLWYMFEGSGQYSWINHGFLISTDNLTTNYPIAVSHIDKACADKAEELSRQQINDFFQ